MFIDKFIKQLKLSNENIIRDKVRTKDRNPASIKPGDMVKVRPLDEIKSTLDKDGRYNGGLHFIDEMAQYCDNTYRVLKRVNKIFDSKIWRMKKSHEIVILDGVFCHGYGPYEECDRTCPFFWKDAWLERIEC